MRGNTFPSTDIDTSFDERFNEVDAANLRANLTETLFLASMYAMSALLRYMASEEDDEEKKFGFFSLINTFDRIQMDITFYTNPAEAETLLRRPVPVMGLVTDIWEWFDAAGRYIQDDDIIKTGTYANKSRLARETMQMTPGLTQVVRTYNTGKMLYNK